MKNMKLVTLIGLGGLFTAITVLLQAAPVFLPVIGMAFSPFSTLSVALAAVINTYLGLGVLLSSAFILIAVSIQEAAILLFATGIFGIVMGAMIFRKGIFATIVFSSISLCAGMMILTFIIVVPGFAEFAASLSFISILFIFLLFSFIYVSIWSVFFRRFANYLLKLNLY